MEIENKYRAKRVLNEVMQSLWEYAEGLGTDHHSYKEFVAYQNKLYDISQFIHKSED